MKWLRRKSRKTQAITPGWVHDGVTRNYMSAYWWEPGCKCHWSAGIEGDYCDFCKTRPRKSDGAA